MAREPQYGSIYQYIRGYIMLTMIIVDDEQIILESLMTLINWESIGVKVIGSADNGASAVDLTLKLNPDIVLSDISMPHFTGIQMLETLRHNNIQAEVIFISAYSRFEYAKDALTYGAFDYVLKPIQEDLLLETVGRCATQIRKKQERKLQLGAIQSEVPALFARLLREGRNPTPKEESLLIAEEISFTDYPYMQVFSFWGVPEHPSYTLEDVSPPSGVRFYPLTLDDRQQVILLLLKEPFEEKTNAFLQNNLQIGSSAQSLVISSLFPVKDGVSALSAQLGFCYVTAQQKQLFSLTCSQLSAFMEVGYPTPLEGEKSIVTQVKEGRVNEINSSLYKYLSTLYQKEPSFEIGVVKLYFIQLLDAVAKELKLIHLTPVQIQTDFLLKTKQTINSQSSIDKIYHITNKTLEDWAKETEKIKESSTSHLASLAVQYIMENYSKDITLGEVAKQLHVSSGHLSKVFREEIGDTFSRYLQDYRLSKAKDLLLTTNYKVYEIADWVGYNDVAHFSKSFKQSFGVSPNEFRNA